ncbi:MAG: bifunctional folylpolyglutamate synthase/dihydrofolate synthase [Bacillota bacterium]
MQYGEAINYIHATLKFGVKLGLDNIKSLLDLMGNPHQKLKYVHVAGTNGKGSTVAFISSILISAGYKVGVYTSPYIERFTERIKINKSEISEEDLARITSFVKEKVEIMIKEGKNHPTEFEIVTAIAFQYFYEMGCDIVVLEVGLGGRFDSTNVIDKPLVAVITTISYDHMDKLGDTLAKIAFEKAGIIKEATDVVIYPQSEEAEKVFGDACTERRALLHKVCFEKIEVRNYSIDGQEFDYDRMESIRISLLGEHQIKNAVVAIETAKILAIKGYKITEDIIRRGLGTARWPGRLEVLRKEPVFLIDGAHNQEGSQTLANVLKTYFPDKKILFILGVLKDKDYRSIIEACAPIASQFITITPKSDRALPAKDLAEIVECYCNNLLISDTIEDAVRTSLELSPKDGVICAFGSLYYIGEVRRIFEEEKVL